MKNDNKILLYFYVIIFLFTSSFSIAKNLITKNKSKLDELKLKSNNKYIIQKQKAIKFAKQKGWKIKYKNKNGREIELQGLRSDSKPIYFSTYNLNSAKTSSIDKIWPGGTEGLSLTGSGIFLGEWDGGGVRTTHQEFDGRAVQCDNPSELSSHSTHVAGTMIAEGQDPNAKGMAYQVNLWAFDWNNDESEMAAAAADSNLTISNHSYGIITGWYYDGSNWYWYGTPSISETEDYTFGFYSSTAQYWDEIAENAPYYLIVKSAGNDRNDGPSSGTGHYIWDGSWTWSTTARDTDGGPDGYDCISSTGNAKNILTVGAVDDIPSGYSKPSDVQQNNTYFSAWGPSDDGRIKPDIVANGDSLKSCDKDADDDYTWMSGTSMSAPSVSGALVLLTQHYKNTHNNAYMKSATMKALVIHSADEAGEDSGPDYRYGWGLLNAKQAAKIITNNSGGDNNLIGKYTLNNYSTHTFNYYSYGNSPIKVTICWTDPAPSSTPYDSLNPRTKMLVNDLDLRISNSEVTYYPWTLDVENPSLKADTGDNSTDNVEQVYINNPKEGLYTITVNHKNSLKNGQQDYSIIVTGLLSQKPDTTKINTAFHNIEIDGSNDFNLPHEEVGACTTPTNWGASNVLDTLYITYNGGTLFGAVSGTFNDAGNNYVIIYIDRDFGKNTGINNMNNLTDNSDYPDDAISSTLNAGVISGFGAELAVGWNGNSLTGGVRRFETSSKYGNFDWITAGNITGSGTYFEFSIPIAEIYNDIEINGNKIAVMAVLVSQDGTAISNQIIPDSAITNRNSVIISIDNDNNNSLDNFQPDTILSAYNNITIDGINDFNINNEQKGYCKTSANWGAGNVLDTLYVTYNSDTLYLGISGALGDGTNRTVVYIDRDFGKSTGVSNMNLLSDNTSDPDNAISSSLDLSSIKGFGAELAFGWNGVGSTGGVRRFETAAKYNNFDWISESQINGDANFVECAIPFSSIYNDTEMTGNQVGFAVMISNQDGSVLSNQYIPDSSGVLYGLVILTIDDDHDNIPDNISMADTTAPLDITGIRAYPDNASATVVWTSAAENDSDYYNIYYDTQKIISVYASSVIRAGTIPINSGDTFYKINNLKSGVTYYFTVTCVDTNGNEDIYPAFSDSCVPYYPDTPSLIINTNSGKNNVTFLSLPLFDENNPYWDIDFFDNISLDSCYYKINNGTWKYITTNGTNIAVTNGDSYLTNWKVLDADWNSLTEDTHTIYFKAVDSDGFETGAEINDSVYIKFIIDKSTPQITINDDSYTVHSKGDNLGSIFDIDFFDTLQLDTIYYCVGTANTYTINSYPGTAFSDNWSISNSATDNLNNGNNQIYVTAIDLMGHKTSSLFYINKNLITIDGDTSDWNNYQFLQSHSNNVDFYLTWDDANFYIAVKGIDLREGSTDNKHFIYFCIDTDCIAGSGGSSLNNEGGIVNFNNSDYRPEYIIRIRDNSGPDWELSLISWNGSGWDWNNYTWNWAWYAGWSGNKITELRIPKNIFYTDLEKGSPMAVSFYVMDNTTDYFWTVSPPTNQLGSAAVNHTDFHYFSNTYDTEQTIDKIFKEYHFECSVSEIDADDTFNFYVYAVNNNNETHTGINSNIIFTINNGNIVTDTMLLISGTNTISDSITGAQGNVICTATCYNNYNYYDTLSLWIWAVPDTPGIISPKNNIETNSVSIIINGTNTIANTVYIFVNNIQIYSDTDGGDSWFFQFGPDSGQTLFDTTTIEIIQFNGKYYSDTCYIFIFTDTAGPVNISNIDIQDTYNTTPTIDFDNFIDSVAIIQYIIVLDTDINFGNSDTYISSTSETTITTPGLTRDTWYIKIAAIDALGNYGYFSNTDSFVIELQKFIITGRIQLESGGETKDINVIFYSSPGNSIIDSDSTIDGGTFTLEIDSGITGYIYAKDIHHLSSNSDTFIITGDTDLEQILSLTAGDVNGDDRINILDASYVKVKLFPYGDIDKNGIIDETDLNYIRANFSKFKN